MQDLPAPLSYRDARLYMDDVALDEIAAALGTPVYVYSQRHIEARYAALIDAFAGTDLRVHYSVKANSNLSILRVLRDLGAGFDIVSGGELSRVLAAQGDPASVIFSGVGKRVDEIDLALKVGIGCFNVESRGELERLAARAALHGVAAPVAVRVNPDVDAQTHPYISTGLRGNKFGVPAQEAMAMYAYAQDHPHLTVRGIDCHIGSQIASEQPLLRALDHLLSMVDDLGQRGIAIEHLDLGGGLGIRYRDEAALDFATYGASVAQTLGRRRVSIMLEPGRSLVASAGVLLTRVEYLKPSLLPDAPNFAVVDGAMNDLIRPALYQAWHGVLQCNVSDAPAPLWDIVGPVCESGDFLAKQRPLALDPGSLLCVCTAGAYGMVQASNYNSRGRAPEVMVRDGRFDLIRRRETISDQLRLEQLD